MKRCVLWLIWKFLLHTSVFLALSVTAPWQFQMLIFQGVQSTARVPGRYCAAADSFRVSLQVLPRASWGTPVCKCVMWPCWLLTHVRFSQQWISWTYLSQMWNQFGRHCIYQNIRQKFFSASSFKHKRPLLIQCDIVVHVYNYLNAQTRPYCIHCRLFLWQVLWQKHIFVDLYITYHYSKNCCGNATVCSFCIIVLHVAVNSVLTVILYHWQ